MTISFLPFFPFPEYDYERPVPSEDFVKFKVTQEEREEEEKGNKAEGEKNEEMKKETKKTKMIKKKKKKKRQSNDKNYNNNTRVESQTKLREYKNI